MKAASLISAQTRRTGTVRLFPRRLISLIPARWRAAVLLAGFALLSPLWLTLVLWDAVLGEEAAVSADIQAAASQH